MRPSRLGGSKKSNRQGTKNAKRTKMPDVKRRTNLVDEEESVRTAIEESLRAYFERRREVVAAILFGSHAVNLQRTDSDVDVAVLLTPEARPRTGELRTLYTVELGRALRKDMHPVIMNLAGEELLKRIFSKGKCLQVNDKRSYASFQISAYCRIADFDHYRKMAQREFMNRLKREVRGG